MYEKLFEHIERNTSTALTDEEKDILQSAFKLKKLRKHQYFLQEGDVCRQAGFVLKGALRQYSVDESGKEHIVSLLMEDWWVGDRESFNNETPTRYFIDAWEDSELLVLSKDDMGSKLLTALPILQKHMQVLTERQSFKLLRRVNSAISLTAEQRLEELEKTYPAFLQRFPLHIIASYLGMTKETLSRIRSRSSKK